MHTLAIKNKPQLLRKKKLNIYTANMVKQRIKTMSTGVSYVISNRHKFGYLISTNITMKQGRTYRVGGLGRPPSYRLANFRAWARFGDRRT